ncbi:NADH:ubiquinone reductase (Na(+)-transporting) subunit B [Myxococcota bacterium]|nr:NADH:ubiquinone reductase (Na(+)-transporting) subunit B [Myxococcota bacterium]MBU1430810.1 NADH:ubiquinone reductase (Na(+)-transporting) subunit B [Myxococcota bacterium]MBU1899664.1 NADH:ubiquinone reductase (Na(+)-transporting) subunit B [Myxococcota bacterium]
MKFLRKLLDSQAKHFEPGGKLHTLYPLWEANDTVLFTPGHVTKGKTHVRDALDLKRMMITVVIALIPVMLFGIYNVGHQANARIAEGIAKPFIAWQSDLFVQMGFTHTDTLVNNFMYGLVFFVPIFLVTFVVGGAIEVITSIVRKHEVNEGFLVTGFLFPLIVPATIPLWQVALGIGFGTLIGKEVFGGTGMNVLNPALVGRAFLFFAYPGQISGDQVWQATDGGTGATLLGQAAADGMGALNATWFEAFSGNITGSIGETSALLCLVGAALLIFTQIASWRTMAGIALGTALISSLLNLVGSETNPMFAMPFYWHMVVGGWAFGAVFMATDPVSSAFTEKGKFIYGLGIGAMVVLVRVVNPAYPEGMMLAILFMNMFAPFIDYFFIQGNIKRRMARNGL